MNASKQWVRPLAVAILDRFKTEGRVTLADAADIVRHMPLEFGIERERVADAMLGVTTKAGRHKGLIRSTLPDRSQPLARCLWRHLQFACGFNVNLHGMFSNLFEVNEIENDVMHDIATLVALIKNGKNIGAERWKEALGL